VRKISGYARPSQANAAAFERAVHEIAHISRHLLDELVTSAPARDREVEAAKRALAPRSASPPNRCARLDVLVPGEVEPLGPRGRLVDAAFGECLAEALVHEALLIGL